MPEKSPKANKNKQHMFKPNMRNFETSCGYEGLTLKKECLSKSIDDLKRLYAR